MFTDDPSNFYCRRNGPMGIGRRRREARTGEGAGATKSMEATGMSRHRRAATQAKPRLGFPSPRRERGGVAGQQRHQGAKTAHFCSMCGPYFCSMNTGLSGSARIDRANALPSGELRGRTKLIKITEDVRKYAPSRASQNQRLWNQECRKKRANSPNAARRFTRMGSARALACRRERPRHREL